MMRFLTACFLAGVNPESASALSPAYFPSICVGESSANQTIANSAAATDLTPTVSIGANEAGIAGMTFFVFARGVISSASTAPTVTMALMLGSTAIATTGANTITASLANKEWQVWGSVSIRTTGTSGALIGGGVFQYSTAATTAAQWQITTTATTAINTTVANTLSLRFTWGTAAAANTVTAQQVIWTRI